MAFKLFGKPKPSVHRKSATKHVKKAIKPVKKVVTKAKPKVVKKAEIRKPEVVSKPKMPIIEKMADDKTYELLKASKLPVLKTVFLKNEKDLEELKKFTFPCMMKVSGTKIIHKTEVGGVVKANSFEETLDIFKRLIKIKGAEKVMAQEMKSGIELIIGAKADAQFGYIVSIGLGGIYVEILKDVKFRICPVTTNDVEAMVKELKGYEILAGARGHKPINFPVLYDLISRVGNFAIKNKIKEMDLNPVFCDEKGCFIADARLIK